MFRTYLSTFRTRQTDELHPSLCLTPEPRGALHQCRVVAASPPTHTATERWLVRSMRCLTADSLSNPATIWRCTGMQSSLARGDLQSIARNFRLSPRRLRLPLFDLPPRVERYSRAHLPGRNCSSVLPIRPRLGPQSRHARELRSTPRSRPRASAKREHQGVTGVEIGPLGSFCKS